ncbi:enoyl-CoA hydratase/isomerase family protein [Pseudomonas sp. LS44]|uniref:enoyl-CoA hydratase/isomerase family protein n=1 Tax=Pseudomonas sp. LS44 TaxID=1357074 RepID=UPI00215B0CE2|nr:enoyl-CoA hydratase/isomerase family protein [Pseudomonas sp. LS44]UVE19570.1 enoyl-CoA hydratase/isomerase family protein [Pseudomonas sp. LS44]
MSNQTNAAVLYEKIGKTAVITLNRPQTRNALEEAVMAALPEVVRRARNDRSVASVVLTGAGGAFCSGAYLGEANDNEKTFIGRDIVLDSQDWFAELANMEKPVIAAVDGVAVGAGFSLALAADFIFLSPRARLMPSFLGVGLVPDLSMMYVLPRLVGLAKAKEIVFSALPVAVEDAVALGIAQAVVPAESLLDEALAYARRFDNAPPRALALAKTILNRSFETDRAALTQLEAAAQSLCVASDYHAEALRRFMAKEPALYPAAARRPS